jgi:hypothetical protein
MGALYCTSLCARSLSFALQRSAGLKWHTYSLCRTTLELFHPFGPELGGILTVSSVPTGRTGVPCEKSEVFPSPSDQPSIVPRARMYRLSRWGATLYHTCVSPRAAPAPSSKSVFLRSASRPVSVRVVKRRQPQRSAPKMHPNALRMLLECS